jgi:hypothetical protein
VIKKIRPRRGIMTIKRGGKKVMSKEEVNVFSSDSHPDIVTKMLREIDKEYLIVDHELDVGDVIPEDAHQSSECIIFRPSLGQCEVTVEGVSKIIQLDLLKTKIVFIAAKKKHSLRAITPISYIVQRNGFK